MVFHPLQTKVASPCRSDRPGSRPYGIKFSLTWIIGAEARACCRGILQIPDALAASSDPRTYWNLLPFLKCQHLGEIVKTDPILSGEGTGPGHGITEIESNSILPLHLFQQRSQRLRLIGPISVDHKWAFRNPNDSELGSFPLGYTIHL